VQRSVGDSARYDVFSWRRRRRPAMRLAALHVLLGLKSEGVEPTLILWALVRELRGLWQAQERDRLRSNSAQRLESGGEALAACAIARTARCPCALARSGQRHGQDHQGAGAGDAWTALTGSPAAWPALCKPRWIQAG
jgi:DNA polymerase-3 subunit delta